MRIRRKKHLAERLSTVLDYVIVPERDIVNVKEAVKDKRYFDYKSLIKRVRIKIQKLIYLINQFLNLGNNSR